MNKIIVDGFGGDNSPFEVVKGVVQALQKHQDLHIILTGNEQTLQKLLDEYEFDKTRLEILNSVSVITCDEAPVEAIRTKKDSSLVVAFDALKNNDEIIGLVSAGSTGAVLTGASLKIGRLKGVSRPALCPCLPTQTGGNVLLIDCGANMDSKPINLCHFALMGSVYAKKILGIENPSVALLNVGVESKKGNELCHKAFELLKQLPINFVGNMEARDFLSGEYDVVVSDGFAGNVLLKSTEGTALAVTSMLKKEIMKRTMSKLGALFMKKSFKALKQTLSYDKQGGSPFLGTKKIIIKCHGSSKATSILGGIEQVMQFNSSGLYVELEQQMLQMDEFTKEIALKLEEQENA